MNRILTLALSCLLLLTAATVTLANGARGTIRGVVVDAENGEPLIGVNVFLEGTMIGAASDLDGNYGINKVPTGRYNLVVSMIGYAKHVVKEVSVNAGELTKIDVALKPEALAVDDVVVTATLIRNTESALLKERQKSVAVSNAISAEAISKTGSGDAAEAMTKVTGASVVSGKYVYVRGLGERYSSTHLNGVELPTADPDRKAFQMDLFPANLLDNIVTLKTFTPDKPGNFSGGVVDIGTKQFPEEFTLSFSSSASFNSQATFEDNFLLYPRGDTDWLAIEDGTRDIPDILTDPDLSIPSAARARIEARRGDTEGAELLDAVSKSFNSVMSPTPESTPVNQSYSFSLGNQRPIFGRPFGYILGVTYNRGLSFYDSNDGGFTGRYTTSDIDAEELNPQILLDDARGKDEVTWGGLLNLDYKLTPHHKLAFNTIYSRSSESMARAQFGRWPKEFGLADTTSFFQNRVLKFTERELKSFQLRGDHFFKFLAKSNIEWSASFANNTQDEPDTRFFANTVTIRRGDSTFSARQSGFSDPQRYFRELKEDKTSFNVDWSIPFQQWKGLSSKLKFGGAHAKSDREFRERIFNISPGVSFTGDPETFFSDANMGAISVDTLANGRLNYTFGNTVSDRSKLRNNYDGDRTISALYGMLELPLTSRLRLVGGLRYETTDLRTVSLDTLVGEGKLEEKDFLPSVNLIYALTPNMNLRGAFTKTLARPTFREIAPFESFEFINGNFLIGNAELERTLITNFDLRWEWFMRPGELVAVSGFLKDMKNPIERVFLSTNGQVQYQNVDEAAVFGLELEVRKQLDGIAGFLRHFNAGANVTLAESSVDVVAEELEIRRAVDPSADDTRSLQGQSPFLFNFDISYSNPASETNLSLSFNTFGDRLSNVSLGGTPDVFERRRDQLNFTASQVLFNFLNVKFSVKNILNEAFKESYEFKGGEFVYQQYKTGRQYSIGTSYNF